MLSSWCYEAYTTFYSFRSIITFLYEIYQVTKFHEEESLATERFEAVTAHCNF